MLDATASSASYFEFASGYGFSRDKSLWHFDQYPPSEVDRRAPQVSPLFEPHLAGLPRTLIVTAECDPLRDEGQTYAQKLRNAGVEVDDRCYRGMIHGFFQMTGALESSQRLLRDLGDWVRDDGPQGIRLDGQRRQQDKAEMSRQEAAGLEPGRRTGANDGCCDAVRGF